MCFLTRVETDALLAVPDQSTPLGRRDHLLLLVALQTGLRVSELTSLTCADAELGTGAHLRCTGRGRKQRATPHTLRHTAAMALLHAGVDTSTIALWLGHATTKATDVYLHADLATKEKALARTALPSVGTRRYRPGDTLLAFLENL
ncbi:tyrosine-type recombinase/integrase [Nonomuraea turcica]|uniref:tyrosine-type recombinase/integrase n=1 Tax=Nonomuraea sp. G32 TaxID=3067274 RepID=UPI00273CD90D|nr:tyrosine-type recombinase/integrase [Nonomuraea sp. G32]MDP4511518.1 tyrosine-type recombinase/integrase [Nonomuraea sp. G32]